jgi:hypothetical protein
MEQLRRQLKWSKKKTAYAWAMYYKQIEEKHNAELLHFQQLEAINNQEKALENLPNNLVNEFAEMAKSLKKKLECPICLDVIESDTLTITGCGHKYCKTCRKKIKKCAVCRKKVK